VLDAYFKMERVEHYAQILFVARMLGGEKVLTQPQAQKLLEQFGIPGPPGNVTVCTPAGMDRSAPEPDDRPGPSGLKGDDLPPRTDGVEQEVQRVLRMLK
jgi:hypothetical protein